MNSKTKYIKYKKKYLELKKKIGGSNMLNENIIYKSEKGFPIVIKDNNFIIIKSNINDNGFHSSMSINDPYNTFNMYEYYMLCGLLILPSLKNYLLIGLGGGYTAKIILKLFPDIDLDIVEYSTEIVYVAKEYFKFIPSDNTNIYINDGVKFIMDLKFKKYDIISLDAFNENSKIPSNFLTDIFFNKIKMNLSDNGLFIINSILDSVTIKKLLERNFKYFVFITVSPHGINNIESYNNLVNGNCESINYVFIASMTNFLNINRIGDIDLKSIKLPIENMKNALITSINRKNNLIN